MADIFAHNIWKCIFFNENIWILIQNMKWIHQSLVDSPHKGQSPADSSHKGPVLWSFDVFFKCLLVWTSPWKNSSIANGFTCHDSHVITVMLRKDFNCLFHLHLCWLTQYLLTWGPFTKRFNFNPSLESNHMSSKVCGEITFPFPNFSGATIEVWEWISNFIPHFSVDVITYPCWD